MAAYSADFGRAQKLDIQFTKKKIAGLALLYHDAIYDPASPTNEQDSANLFAQILSDRLTEKEVALGRQIILDTKGHQLSSNYSLAQKSDAALCLDLDLSILGQAPKEYQQYCQAVQKEYDFVPPALFREGRIDFLKKMLGLKQLYHSPLFQLHFERRARQNMQAELDFLKKRAVIS